MFCLRKLINGWPSLILFLIIGLVASPSSPTQRETKKALTTIGRFLRSKTGTNWLAGLAQTKSGPLTTAELMNRLIESTKPDGKVSKSAKFLRKALETQKLEKGNSDVPDAWDYLIKDIEDQDDIICLYRKDSDSSMRKADDWKKFLKSVSFGYTVHLALDKGQKYVICLKKISVPDPKNENSTPTLEISTNLLEETTTKESDIKETTKEPYKEKDDKETTENILETTLVNQSSEFKEKFVKALETRKSRFGPSVDDIKKAEAEAEDEGDSKADCSGEDSDEDESEDNEDDDKKVDEDAAKPKPPCSRQIIVMVPNPYGTPGSPNNWVYFAPQVPKDFSQLPPTTNHVRKFVNSVNQPNLNPWNRWNWRYPFTNKDPKGFDPKFWYQNQIPFKKEFSSGSRGPEFSDGKWILDSENPMRFKNKLHKSHGILNPNFQPGQNSQPLFKYFSGYTPKSLGDNIKSFRNKLNSLNSNHHILKKKPKHDLQNSKLDFEPADNWYQENPKFPFGSNLTQLPNFGSMPAILGLNSGKPSSSNRFNYPLNYMDKYSPQSLDQILCLPGANENPRDRRCQPNQLWEPLNSYGQMQNFKTDSMWLNQQKLSNKQLIFPDSKQRFPNNQQMLLNNQQKLPNSLRFPNNQMILPNNQQRLSHIQMYPDNQQELLNNQIYPDNQQRLPNNKLLYSDNQQRFPNNQLNYPYNQQGLLNNQIYPDNQQRLPNNKLVYSDIQQRFPNTQLIYPYNQQGLLSNQIYPDNQQRLPNNKLLYSNNQQRLSNNQLTYSNNEQRHPKIFPNSGPSLLNAASCKCPFSCDKPIELRISIEGNVDKPVKIGVLSQPGMWVNIVNNKENSRRMLGRSEENEGNESEKEDEGSIENRKDKEAVTDNFDDELIQNQEKKDEKKDEKVEAAKKEENTSQEENEKKAEKEKEEENKEDKGTEKEIESRILSETMTTVLDIKSTDITTVTMSTT